MDEELEEEIVDNSYIFEKYYMGNTPDVDRLQWDAEFRRYALQRNPKNIRLVHKPDKIDITNVIRTDYTCIKYVQNKLTKSELKEIIHIRPKSIAYINNPSDELKLLAINMDGHLIRDIIESFGENNITYEMKFAAIRRSPNVFKYIYNLCKDNYELQKYAVTSLGKNINYIENKTKELINTAFIFYGEAIQYIKDPTYEQKKHAIKKSNGRAIKYIKNPDDDLIRLSIYENSINLKYITNLKVKHIKLAINRYGSNIIKFIDYNKYMDEKFSMYCIDKCDEHYELEDIKKYILMDNKLVKEYFEIKYLLLGGYSGENLNN
jgi:hypothetical protein